MAFARGWGFAAALLAATSATSFAQSVGNLTNPGPADGTIYGFLMTDGTVLYQGGNLGDWWKFAPDQYGSYLNGTWTQVASLPATYEPYATTGQVLPDGRLLLIGGEYLVVGEDLVFELTSQSAIYDPVNNTWTMVRPPRGWNFIGDSPSTVLAGGSLLLGQKITKRAALFNAATRTWTEVATPGKRDFNAEEGWTLLPDGSVLTVDVKDHPRTERFIPNSNPLATGWLGAGETPENLQADDFGNTVLPYGNGRVYHAPGEVGPAMLRPDGTVFATGATGPGQPTGHNAVFHPGPRGYADGFWTAAPDFPTGIGAGDSYAVLLPDGHVLVETNPVGAERDSDLARLAKIRGHAAHLRAGLPAPAAARAAPSTPIYNLFDFDGTNLTLVPVTISGGQLSLLMLPNGQVDVGGVGIYVPEDGYAPEWAPTIAKFPKTIAPGGSYLISGTQFNGLSQAQSYGDEFPVATNFPLVRITNSASGRVVYARTHDHSTMAVATGSLPVSTHFDVPDAIEPGASVLEVVANGIPSAPVAVTVAAQ
jgi:hypothetical protein